MTTAGQESRGDMPYEPGRYRKCPVCLAALGQPCTTLTGALIHGRPYPQVDPVTSNRDRPHSRRQLRSGAVS